MKRIALASGFCLAAALSIGCAVPAVAELQDWRHGGAGGKAVVCRPDGPGPFPLVVFNHGMIVDIRGYRGAAAIGYDLDALCRGLAEEGFLGFFPIRRSGRGNLRGHKAEVAHALDAAKARPDVDTRRIALAGFSRGGLLALMAAVERADYRALVLLAPAPGRGHFSRAAAKAARIDVPVLVMVETGDSKAILDDVDELESALRAARGPAKVIRYDRGGGHKLFWGVGYYWSDLIAFLKGMSG